MSFFGREFLSEPQGGITCMLEIRHLTKIYEDGTVALDDVSFSVPDGEFLVVIGLSGSGKSTLLRCINRLIDPTEGEILWNGKDLAQLKGTELRMARRKIGMVFQQFNLVRRSKVISNVLSGRLGYTGTVASLLNRFSDKDMQMAQDAMRRLGIENQAMKLARELSGGQQQRVGIARALMQEPEMILADEPVASLDPVLAHSILQYLELLNQEDDMTILCSLHYLDLVQRYATSVIGLRAGKIVYQGSKEDIMNMNDRQFKDIYGEEAERLGSGLKGDLAEEEVSE
jgi:phosphonate transport system ATP-binding protein